MPQKLSREDFIRRAKEIHGDKYDYSKVEYKNSQIKVCIICKEHGEFWQTPDSHINQKQNCPLCAKKINIEKNRSRQIWTYDTCYEEAKQYTCSSDFQEGNGSAYGVARKNGWIKDYNWFIIKHRNPYTYDECYEIAKKYKSRVELARGNVGVYQAALNHGWLDDYTWFESPQRPYNYWTKKRCAEESKKYKTRGEFHDKCGTAYGKSRINGWLDEFTWLKDERIDFSNDKIDLVYAYEFMEFKSVYVGRTLMRRSNERDQEHIFTDNDAVYQFAKEKKVQVPKMKILEENLTVKEGAEKEGFYVEEYRKKGWNILNRTKTGALGLLFKDKWNKKACYQEAKKYKTRGEFAENNGSAYDAARRNGWLDDYTWFEMKQKPGNYWNNYENCYNAAKECKTVSEFYNKYGAGAASAKRNGWMDDYVWFKEYERISWNKKWYYENTYEEAKKYKSRKEFSINAHGAYKVAIKNGWIKDYDWFGKTSDLLREGCKSSWQERRKWTYDNCKQIACNSKGRLDFRKCCPGAYNAAWVNGWLNDFFPETTKWDYDTCKNAASKSKGKNDFSKKYPGAYISSLKNKWLNDFFPENLKHYKKVLQYSIDGMLIKEYNSLTEASKCVGDTIQNISNVLTGRQKTSKGYIWKYKYEK